MANASDLNKMSEDTYRQAVAYAKQQALEQANAASSPVTPTVSDKNLGIALPSGADTNTFYIDVKVFLEGVQVPHMQAAVSYGIDAPPTATLVIPAAQFLRNLPETTKVLILFKDLLPDGNGEYKWRVLFDGEMSGFGYSIDSNGATLSITAVHSTAYLTLIQLMNVSVRDYITNPSKGAGGDLAFWQAPPGGTATDIKFLETIIEDLAKSPSETKIKSMADLVYILLRNIIEGHRDASSVARWMWLYLGSTPGGLKILDRIYGVTDTIKNDDSLIATAIPKGSATQLSVVSSVQHPNGEVLRPVLLPGSDNTVAVVGDGEFIELSARGWTTQIPYKVVDVRNKGAIGIGGDSGVNSTAIIDRAATIVGTTYTKGGDGTKQGGTDCGQTVVSATYGICGISERYIPNMVLQAQEEGIYTAAVDDFDALRNAKAGDIIIVGMAMDHAVISDGNGGYYGASKSQKQVVHEKSLAADFPDIIGVIHTSDKTVRGWGEP